MEALVAFWRVIHFARQLASDSQKSLRLFGGDMANLLPTRRMISGPRQVVLILWTSGDAPLSRIRWINWARLGYYLGNPNLLIEPFLGMRRKDGIYDFEFSGDIGGVRLWGGESAKEATINLAGEKSALGWIDGGRLLSSHSSRLQLSYRSALIRMGNYCAWSIPEVWS